MATPVLGLVVAGRLTASTVGLAKVRQALACWATADAPG